MDEPVAQALRRMVSSSESPEELRVRVVRAFGEGLLSSAWEIAAETKGGNWLHQGQAVPEHKTNTVSRGKAYSFGLVVARVGQIPTSIVLLFGSFVLIGTLLFPPFIVLLPEGLMTNGGFAFLLTPPRYGQLVGVVNVTLLAIEVAVVVAVTVAGYLIAHSINGDRK